MATKVRIVGLEDEREQDAEPCDEEAEEEEQPDRAPAVGANLLLEGHQRSKATADRSLSILAGLEELPRREAEEPRDDQRRERLLARVEAQHGRVVVPAGGGDLVLGVRQLLLELHEVLGRAELRIRLRDGEQPAERRPEHVVRLGRRLRAGGAHDRGARPCHLVEDLALVRRVPLHGLHEVRDEVGAATQLDVDVRPARLGLVADADEAVVRVDDVQAEDEEDGERDPQHERHRRSLTRA